MSLFIFLEQRILAPLPGAPDETSDDRSSVLTPQAARQIEQSDADARCHSIEISGSRIWLMILIRFPQPNLRRLRLYPGVRPPNILALRPARSIAFRRIMQFRMSLSANDAATFSQISTPTSNQGGPYDPFFPALSLTVLVYIGISENIVHVNKTIKGHVFSLLQSFVLNRRH